MKRACFINSDEINSVARTIIPIRNNLIRRYIAKCLIVFVFCTGVSGQTKPAVTMRTGMAINSSFSLSLTANANNTLIQVDFGNSTMRNFTIGISETTINGNLGDSHVIQIYGTGIVAMDCSLKQLTALDVSNCTELKELDCHGNRITTLDLKSNTLLEFIACQDNQIAELNLTNIPELYTLYCNMNKLSVLNVTNNKNLIDLSCEDNQIETLDVSNNTKLEFLFCQNNQLSALDVSKNTALWTLRCQHNGFTFATLPIPQSTWSYLYAPQRAIVISKNYKVGNTVDLSSQSLINGKSTIYTWKTKAGATLLEGTNYSIENGQSTFLQTQADSVYCEMTNPTFPFFKQTNVLKTTCSKILVTGKQIQTITFAPINGKKVNDAPFELTATASSGLSVTFTSADPSIASIVGNMVTIHKAGSVLITASQAGNENWEAANITQALTISSATGIEEMGKEYTISPNPVANTLYIKTPNTGNSMFAIFNMAGRKVQSGITKDRSIDVSGLHSGVYLLHLEEEGKQARIVRFIKQ